MEFFVPLILLALLVVVSFAAWQTIRALGRLADCIEGSLGRTQQDITLTLRKAQATLERVETLAQSADGVIRENVAPTLGSARSALDEMRMATRTVNETVGGVQRVVKGVAAVSSTGALAVVTQRLLRRGNRLGLLAFGVGSGLRAFFGDGSRRNRPPFK